MSHIVSNVSASRNTSEIFNIVLTDYILPIIEAENLYTNLFIQLSFTHIVFYYVPGTMVNHEDIRS